MASSATKRKTRGCDCPGCGSGRHTPPICNSFVTTSANGKLDIVSSAKPVIVQAPPIRYKRTYAAMCPVMNIGTANAYTINSQKALRAESETTIQTTIAYIRATIRISLINRFIHFPVVNERLPSVYVLLELLQFQKQQIYVLTENDVILWLSCFICITSAPNVFAISKRSGFLSAIKTFEAPIDVAVAKVVKPTGPQPKINTSDPRPTLARRQLAIPTAKGSRRAPSSIVT
uniref:Uncharacterized protein n=1 Tax=Glossina brevipalpis TaxID=37001 RepID=A0A1A9W1K8_9MUSC